MKIDYKYYCNSCRKEYPDSLATSYENLNEELGEDVIEKGEYKCRRCYNLIELYRKFNKYKDSTNSFK